MGFFHKAIITSLCCIILTGCGYKTNPVYTDDNAQTKSEKVAK